MNKVIMIITKRYITFYKAKKIMEYEFKRIEKYRNDYKIENYNKKLYCLNCKKMKYLRLFPYREKLSFNKDKTCKMCLKNISKYKRDNLKLEQVLQVCLKVTHQSAKKRFKIGRVNCGINTITLKDLIQLYYEQNGRCKLSGEKLSLLPNSPLKISIDRIDSNKGYIKDNIQLVTKIVNQAKSDLDLNYFLLMIKNIYETNKLVELKT